MATLVRQPWLAIADPAMGSHLTAACGADRLRVVTDPAAFQTLLASERPRLAILVAPPATDDDASLALRARARQPAMRVVHVTRREDVERRLHALRLGVDEALTVDMDPGELASRLDILDGRPLVPRRHGRDLPVAPGVVLDPVAHEVRRDGALVHLRPKEFQLLAMLAGHPGRAYTRRQLLDRVWGTDHHGDPRTVDVHVRWLRAKLEPTPADPAHLVTVRGVGYRLDPDGPVNESVTR